MDHPEYELYTAWVLPADRTPRPANEGGRFPNRFRVSASSLDEAQAIARRSLSGLGIDLARLRVLPNCAHCGYPIAPGALQRKRGHSLHLGCWPYFPAPLDETDDLDDVPFD